MLKQVTEIVKPFFEKIVLKVEEKILLKSTTKSIEGNCLKRQNLAKGAVLQRSGVARWKIIGSRGSRILYKYLHDTFSL